jgi:hypothetical protein
MTKPSLLLPAAGVLAVRRAVQADRVLERASA